MGCKTGVTILSDFFKISINKRKMKTHRLFIAGLICGMFVLAACEGGTVPTAQIPAAQTPATPGIQQTGNLQITETQQPGTTQAQTQQPAAPAPVAASQADIAAYNGAMQLKDVTFCDKMKDETYKKICKTDVTDQIALDEALNKVDATLCVKLSTKDGQEACKIQVEAANKEAQVKIEQQKITETQESMAIQTVSSGDISKCKQLEAVYVANCELNILLNEAYKANDPKICEQASDSATVEKCKNSYEKAIANAG